MLSSRGFFDCVPSILSALLLARAFPARFGANDICDALPLRVIMFISIPPRFHLAHSPAVRDGYLPAQSVWLLALSIFF